MIARTCMVVSLVSVTTSETTCPFQSLELSTISLSLSRMASIGAR
jgi:hypothetical protein